MKARRVSLIVAAFLVLILLLASTASAAWYICTITRVGASGSNNIVYLTHSAADPQFTNRWFVLNPSIKKELLAIALTAYSSNKKLYVSLPTITAGSTIAGAYMMD
jgi:hypothetical protein